MIIHILDNNLKKIDILRKYTFLQYEDKARELGSFKVLAELVDENTYLLDSSKQFYILFDDRIFGKIEDIVDDSDGEFENTITISGRLSKLIFTKRVIDGVINYSGKTPQFVKAIIDKCITVEDHQDPRYINMNINLDNESYMNEVCSSIEKQVTGGYAWDAISEVLEQDSLALMLEPVVQTVVMDRGHETNIVEWNLIVTKGADRRKDNTQGNTPVIFSRSLSNISRTKYQINTENYCNIAFIAGEGEDSDRKWYTKLINQNSDISSNNVGWNRNELWIDARDIQSEDQETGEQISEEEYEKLIMSRADEKAAENNIEEVYDGTVFNSDKNYTYEKDFFIGDWVTVEDYDLGIYVDAQVTGVCVSEQNSETTIDIVVSYGTIKKTMEERVNSNSGKLEKIDAEVKYINSKVNALSNDYIVEQSTDPYNTYRKWASGLLEQWLTFRVNTSVSKAWGSNYISDGQEGKEYAIPFFESPAVIMSVKGEEADAAWLMQYSAGDKYKTPNFYIIRGDTLSTSKPFQVNAYAWGRWE